MVTAAVAVASEGTSTKTGVQPSCKKKASSATGESLASPNAMRAAKPTDKVRLVKGSSSQQVPVFFGEINANNVEMLRVLNTTIFPVRYNDTFYGDVLFTPKGYSKFAYWDSFVVGAICCRQEPMETPGSRLLRTYIMTLGVLEAYRHYNIGSALLQSVIKCSLLDGIDHIYLHVQTNNTAALAFYRKFGFEITETIYNYYKRIQPPDCYVLVKYLRSQTPASTPARSR